MLEAAGITCRTSAVTLMMPACSTLQKLLRLFTGYADLLLHTVCVRTPLVLLMVSAVKLQAVPTASDPCTLTLRA